MPGARLRSGNPRIAYFGSNWDGERHRSLFERLDAGGFVDFHGRPVGWSYLKDGYRGMVAFDGRALVATLREAGAGLCLHLPTHRASGVPSMRIFEIAAAGAVAICGWHPFIDDVFGDCVLTIDPDADAEAQAEAIRGHWRWIRDNPVAAVALAERAHAIGSRFALEVLLAGVIDAHAVRMAGLQKEGSLVSPFFVWKAITPWRVLAQAKRRLMAR